MPNQSPLLHASFTITVDGSPLPASTALLITQITVEQDVSLPGMFAFELGAAQGSEESAVLDDSLFNVGGAVEIKLGYDKKVESVIQGEITALEPTFLRGQGPRFVVRGYDRRHRLQRGKKTRTFTKQKDSEIASTMASEAGLSAETVDSEVAHDYLAQVNQSDMEFLSERARRIHYELAVEGKTLHFRPAQNTEGETLTLVMHDDLLEFRPRLSVATQPTSLETRAWDAKEKKELSAKAQDGDESSRMGGTQTGAALAEKLFGAAPEALHVPPALSLAELDQHTKAQFNRRLLDYVTGEGVSLGTPSLKPGMVVKIEGAGKRFSGLYYVESTTHNYGPSEPYRTHFVARRSAS